MAQVTGIGLDIIDGSVRKATRQLAERVLCEAELVKYTGFTSKKAAFDFLFGRWAAKEAFYKATGRTDPFSSIEIGASADGKPLLIKPTNCSVLISISHDKRVFAAVAIAFK